MPKILRGRRPLVKIIWGRWTLFNLLNTCVSAFILKCIHAVQYRSKFTSNCCQFTDRRKTEAQAAVNI